MYFLKPNSSGLRLLLSRLNELDETPKTTEDLLTRIAIALEDVAASLKLQGAYWSVEQ